MGIENCCSKPNENNAVLNTEKVKSIEKAGSPNDTVRNEVQGSKSDTNLDLNNKENQSIEVGKSNQIQVEVNSPIKNEKENIENVQSPNPVDTDARGPPRENNDVVSPNPEEHTEEEQGQEQGEEQGEVEGEGQGEGEGEEEGHVEGQVGEQMEVQVEGQLEGEDQYEAGEEYVAEIHEEIEEEEDGEQNLLQEYNDNLGETIGETKIIDNNLAKQEGNQPQNNQQKDMIEQIQSGNNYIITASLEGAVDLNNLPAMSSTEVPANDDDINKFFQKATSISISNTGNIQNNPENISAVPVTNYNVDYNQYSMAGNLGLVGTASSVPAPTNVDLNKNGIQETSSFGLNNYNVSSTTQNVDLSNYNISAVSSTPNNVDISNYNVGAVSTTTNYVDLNSLANNDNNNALPNENTSSTITFGVRGPAEFSAVETSQVNTNNIHNSYGSPLQSYSYNYSYVVPATSHQTNY
jgi:hypothetical protein